jgi:hypothetical protein
VASNSAEFFGGGVLACLLYNSIVFYNAAPVGPNFDDFSTINFSCTTPLPSSGAGNIAQEPGFVNLAGGDYHLQFGSACINAGTNQAWMMSATDLDGNPRISGGTVDMGAYEFQLSTGGFITGGGWVNSPPGGAGKAAFNFAAKIVNGSTVPAGSTQFQTGNLNFASTGYNKLLVAGAQTQLKGRGMINGQGNFGFILRATDGQLSGGGGSDRFRIKIWVLTTSTIVYDNQSGSPDTAALNDATILQGGSILIHKP